MTIVKITNLGDGKGALSVSRSVAIPTYNDVIEDGDRTYEVESVRRFTSNKRADAVRVDVSPITE